MPTDTNVPERMRCPTCRAVQDWSDECRRCRSDLRLLHSAWLAYLYHRHACCLALVDRITADARYHAGRCAELRPGPDSSRLLALAALVSEDWPAAVRHGEVAAEAPG